MIGNAVVPQDALVVDSSSENYTDHYLFRAAMRHFQQGEWNPGLTEMVWLANLYPLSSELRTLIREMEARSRIDLDEADEDRLRKKLRIKRRFSCSLIFVLVGVFLYASVTAYSSWIELQLETAQGRLQEEIRTIDLAVKFRDAQALARSGEPDQARNLIDEIAREAPDYPGLASLLAEVDSGSNLELMYSFAIAELERGNIIAASQELREIQAVEPNYRDVASLVAEIDQRHYLEELVAQANDYYGAGNLPAAIPIYEAIYNQDQDFETELVRTNLVDAYLKLAEEILPTQSSTNAAAEIAESYFRKASGILPQDETIRIARERAQAYLQAREHFQNGEWAEAITGFVTAFPEDTGYAQGTAFQLAYESHLERGDQAMASADPSEALIDYERAVELAGLSGETDLRLFEAQMKVAEAYAASGNLLVAIRNYEEVLDLSNSIVLGGGGTSKLNVGEQEVDAAIEAGNLEEAVMIFNRRAMAVLSSIPAVSYQAETGDNLLLLASKFKTTIAAIRFANALTDNDSLIETKILVIPAIPE